MARGLLNPAEVNVLTELTNLRNRVVHQDDAVVTAESANRYAALALPAALSRLESGSLPGTLGNSSGPPRIGNLPGSILIRRRGPWC
jgi:hypothetical protein